MTKGSTRSKNRTATAKGARKSAKSVTKKTKSNSAKTKKAAAKKTPARKVTKPASKSKSKSASKKAPAKRAVKAPQKKSVAKKAVSSPAKSKSAPSRIKKAAVPKVKKSQKGAAVRAQPPGTVPSPPRRQPTMDESAALTAFERAHREFTHGRFGEARNQFRGLLDKYSQVSEVAARARTYLAIAEARLRTESMLPRDADSLYDRGVIELNRGEYVAAQEMFERALKREPEAAHIHYGLAATRARLGSVDLALQSLQRALDLQPNLRVRAQRDQDLTSLRNDPDFDRLVFQPRP